jgi:hypothetical protein
MFLVFGHIFFSASPDSVEKGDKQDSNYIDQRQDEHQRLLPQKSYDDRLSDKEVQREKQKEIFLHFYYKRK